MGTHANEAAARPPADRKDISHTMRTSIAMMALLLATVAGCGAGSATTSGPEPAGTTSTQGNEPATKGNSAKIGQRLRVKSQSGAADITVLSMAVKTKGKGDFALKPANGRYLVVDVQIKVVEKVFEVNPLYIRYQAGDGKTFEAFQGNAAAAGFEPQLTVGSVTAGQITRGVVVFDAPAGKGEQIQVTDELGGVIGSWEI